MPGCRLQADYGDINKIPMLLGMRARARVLRLRALARLQAGRPDAAIEDILTGLRITQHLQREPHLLSQLLRLAYVGILMQPVWEGLQAHAWNEAQLARLETALEPIDLIASMKLAWRFERVWGAAQLGKVAEDPAQALFAALDGKPEGRMVRWARRMFIPRGWTYQNLAARDRIFERGIEGAVDPSKHRVYPEVVKAETERLLTQRRTPYSWLVRLTVPALLGQNLRVARAQSALDQARVACALERYRLTKGAYPDGLDALAPAFLGKVPHDLIGGAPLRYARRGQGFQLYSVGWNGRDDGGHIAESSKGQSPDPGQGDWVWSAGE
jgi:hypothetical protein